MFVLDTNVVSELRRPDKADRNVVAWVNTVPMEDFYISAISVLELELGILLKERKDRQQGAILRGWLTVRCCRLLKDGFWSSIKR